MKKIKGAMFYSLIGGWCVYSAPNHSIKKESLRMGIKLLPATIHVSDKVYKKISKKKQPSSFKINLNVK